MTMKSSKILWPALFFLLFEIRGTCGYRKYYVEDECSSPSDFQKVFFRLPKSGSDSVGELRSNRFGTYSRRGRKCLLKLLPPEGHAVIVTVLRVDFRNHEGCKDFIKIYADDDERICGSQKLGPDGKSYFSTTEVKILYNTDKGGMGFSEGFRLIFTVTKIDDDNSTCVSPEEFKCQNSRCIWAGVKCDGVNNCGDGSDEHPADHCTEITPVAIVAVVLGVASFVAVLVLMCLCCCSAQPNLKPPLIKPPLIKPRADESYPLRPQIGTIILPNHNYGAVSYSFPYQQQWPVVYASAPPVRQAPSCPPKVDVGYNEPPPPYKL